MSSRDLTKLPVDASLLCEDPALLVSAIQTFYQETFRSLGGTANILVRDDVVSVSWYPGGWFHSCIPGFS